MGLTPLQRLAHVLRKFHLLQAADTFWFLRMYWQSRAANNRFKKQHPDVPSPPWMMLYDIQGNCDLAGFHASGKESATEIARLVHENAHAPGGALRILEWGCGPARVLQHLDSGEGSPWQLYGSDYNPRTVQWCRQRFPRIHFLDNGLLPPMPMEAGSIDVFYCISVFTHLSEESHYQWIEEVQRLLKPGGLFIGTFHGDAFRGQLTAEEQQGYDCGQLVVRDKIQEGKKNFSAYHCDSIVRRLLSPFDAVTKQNMPDSFHQTVWTAVKKGS